MSGGCYITQQTNASGDAEHSNHPLGAILAADVDRPGRGRAGGCKRHERAAPELHWFGRRHPGQQTDLSSWEHVRQKDRPVDDPIGLGLNILRQHSVAVPVLIEAEGDSASAGLEPERDSGRSTDSLGAGQRHARGEIARRRQSSRAIDRREDLRNRDGRKDTCYSGDEDSLEQREAVRITTPKTPRVCGMLAAPGSRYCVSLPFDAVTVTSGFSFRKLFSPMPRTFIRSSGFLKPPFF